jgi:hypothetical protein
MRLKFKQLINFWPFGLISLWLLLWTYNAYTHIIPPIEKDSLKIEQILNDCDLQKKSCIAEIPSGTKFEINLSKPVIPNRLTKVTLKIIQGEDIPMAIDLNGMDIDMGYNRPILKQVTPDYFEGEFILPTCNSKSFNWKAIALFRNNENEISGTAFHFIVDHR